ncbi:MAG: peptidase M14 [Acidobacteria bacterium]|nr:peptidase M14 [Acidobacteriota bacterium]
MTARSCRVAAFAGLLVMLMLGCGPGGPTSEQPLLTTRAERTRYEQSTGYGEVVQFLERAAGLSDRVHVTTVGSTVEGRPLPLVIVGDTIDARPESVTSGDRTRVWLQANIHGGEVCGKEALLMLLRDLVAGEHDDWLSSLTLLIAPIYNADGNELIGPDNRPFQFGPFQGVGVRTNAQGLDLNRDHTKLESPEAGALARAYQDYDPHVVVDLHTTNGTEHAYHLTYAPPLHPNTHPAIDALLRDEWLPAVTEAIKATYGWDVYYYGNTPRGAGTEPTWNTFDHRPRFNNSYVGLRNRFGILSEAYAYAPFDERVAATLRFVEEVLAFASERAGAIADLVDRINGESVVGTRLATRAIPDRSAEPVEILLGETDEVENPYTRAPMRRRLETVTPTMMYDYGRFVAADDGDELAPEAYYVPADLTAVVDLLAAHGVDGASLDEEATLTAEQFVITGSSQANRLFEGHRERIVEGAWEPAERLVPAGTLVIPVSQPLGRLVFTLLEPRSDDGAVNWNLLDGQVESGSVYPILRVLGTDPVQP